MLIFWGVVQKNAGGSGLLDDEKSRIQSQSQYRLVSCSSNNLRPVALPIDSGKIVECVIGHFNFSFGLGEHLGGGKPVLRSLLALITNSDHLNASHRRAFLEQPRNGFGLKLCCIYLVAPFTL